MKIATRYDTGYGQIVPSDASGNFNESGLNNCLRSSSAISADRRDLCVNYLSRQHLTQRSQRSEEIAETSPNSHRENSRLLYFKSINATASKHSLNLASDFALPSPYVVD